MYTNCTDLDVSDWLSSRNESISPLGYTLQVEYDRLLTSPKFETGFQTKEKSKSNSKNFRK